jgi:hypothetical protein
MVLPRTYEYLATVTNILTIRSDRKTEMKTENEDDTYIIMMTFFSSLMSIVI